MRKICLWIKQIIIWNPVIRTIWESGRTRAVVISNYGGYTVLKYILKK
jgi:hypothetical protein